MKTPIRRVKFYVGGPTYQHEEFIAGESAEQVMQFVRETHTAYTPTFYLVERTNVEVEGIRPSKHA